MPSAYLKFYKNTSFFQAVNSNTMQWGFFFPFFNGGGFAAHFNETFRVYKENAGSHLNPMLFKTLFFFLTQVFYPALSHSRFPYSIKWATLVYCFGGFFWLFFFCSGLQYWILHLLKLTQSNKACRAKSNDHIQISIWERVCAKEDALLLMFE